MCISLRKPSVPDPALPTLACDLKRSWQAGVTRALKKFAFLARVSSGGAGTQMGEKMRQGPLGYFADMIVSPLLAGGLSTFALTHFTNYALVRWLAMVMLGVALWTLIEYATHRVIYHRVPTFKKYHEAHHADPQAYIGAPPLLGTIVVFLISFVPVATLAPALAIGLSVGMLRGYTVYLLVHHAIHIRTPTPGTYLYRARLHHAVHHYRDDEGNFGVTTSFWDRVFGTRIVRVTDLSFLA